MDNDVELICELCGNKADMDFNCLLPKGDKTYFLKGAGVCFDCYGSALSDYIIAIKIIKKRDDIQPGYAQIFLQENEIKENF